MIVGIPVRTCWLFRLTELDLKWLSRTESQDIFGSVLLEDSNIGATSAICIMRLNGSDQSRFYILPFGVISIIATYVHRVGSKLFICELEVVMGATLASKFLSLKRT